MGRLKKQFDCYDRLPETLRTVLANAAFDWDATLVAEALDLGAPPEGVIARIREDERRRLPIDNYVMYGPAHPQAAASVQANWLKYYHYPLTREYWWVR
ncbi:DUF6525 family protein [Beijerinckia indica]|uniref:Uncharacterized protein n=1 Tax=Beijerinckia indica subsp. indica (strain ATCC 9039 / DSM 1715 / NCIMB 8712) TaxID=395963 RepID=B2IJH5_BEII9|nr:hypothetical protein Bind_2716 [Beijerinckia indica subsp. indica ATCC 9039]